MTVGIFQTIWVWNDFLAPNVFIISPQNYTLVLQVYHSVGQYYDKLAGLHDPDRA